MRYLNRLAALLLPALSTPLVIPNDPLPAAGEHAPENSHTNAPLFEYNALIGSTIKFSLPCDGCEEDERKRLEDEGFTISIPHDRQLSCANVPDTGVRVNGEPLIAERIDLDGHRRLGHPTDFLLGSHTNSPLRADWELLCGCSSASRDADGHITECLEHEYALVFQLHAGSSTSSPRGFTLTYDQWAGSKDVRLSPFVENIANDFDGLSFTSVRHLKHWSSPAISPSHPSGVLSPSPSDGETSPVSFTEPAPHNLLDSERITPTTTLEEEPTSISPVSSSTTQSPSVYFKDEDASFGPDLGAQRRLDVDRFLTSVRHGVENLEDYTVHAAQSVLKTLNEHIQHCHHSERPINSEWQSSRVGSHATTTYKQPLQTREPHPSQEESQKPVSNHRAAVIALQVTAGLGIFLAVGCAALIHLRCDPRKRAELAARCEERRNRRLYRQAARKQKWKNFFNRLRGAKAEPQSYQMPHSPNQASFDEKDFAPAPNGMHTYAYAYHQTAVREELRGIRKAHRFVENVIKGGLLEAEKGAPRTRHTRSWSLAESEKSIPPPYEERIEDTVISVDGLTFVSQTLIDESPDSSVIDTSSRNSCCGSSDDEKSDG